MNTLQYLNGIGTNTITYTDNRPADVIFDRPAPKDTAAVTTTDVTFTVIPAINIVEIIQPNATNIRYKIELYDLSAVVEYDSLPAGCQLTIESPVYTVSGIDSVEDWEAVKAPTIRLSSDQFGDFSYQANIIYDTATQTDVTLTWEVGYYIPQSLMESIATLNFGNDVSILKRAIANLRPKFTLSAELIEIFAQLQATSTVSIDGFLLKGALYHVVDPNVYGGSTNLNNFARAISISDSYIIAAASGETDATNTNLNSGAAYVFNKLTGTLVYTFTNPNDYSPTPSDVFGFAVAITDNYALVSAPAEDATSQVADDGRAYIFRLSDGTLLHTLQQFNDEFSANDQFGYSVALTDTYATISAPFDSQGENGVVYVYNPSTGNLRYSISDPDYASSPSGDFGLQVEVVGDKLAVGGSERIHVYNLTTTTRTLDYSISHPISGNTFAQTSSDPGLCFFAMTSTHLAVIDSTLDKLFIFDLTTKTLLRTIDVPDGTFVYPPTISINDNNVFVTLSPYAYQYNILTGNLVNMFLDTNTAGTARFTSSTATNDKLVLGNRTFSTGTAIVGRFYVYNVGT